MKKYIGLLIIGISTLLPFGCNIGQGEKPQASESGLTTKADSIEILTQRIREDSTDYALFFRRAVFNVDKGKLDPALRDLMHALELKPDEPQLYLLLSDIYFLLEKPQNSIEALKKTLALDSKNLSALLKLAEIYMLKAEYQTAQQYTDAALRLNSSSAEAYYLKAIARLEMQDTTDALNNLKISARLDTVNYMAFMQLAAIYNRMGDTLCISWYRKALRVRPNDEKALFLLGLFYQGHHEFEKALQTYRTLTDNYPNHVNAFYNAGYIYLVDLEELELAAEAFQRVIGLNPADVRAVYNLGRTYEAMGLFEKARRQYRSSLELLPNYPLAVQGLNRLDEMGK